jgi:16S rRNA (guanine1207-N2)-methyltransferase
MQAASSDLVYGAPPPDLASVPPGARQVSPLALGSFALEEVEPDSQESVTLLAPPGTIERRYALALSLRALREGGTLTALAPKDKGGSRIGKELSAFGASAEEDSKRHHRICRVQKSALNNEALAAAIHDGAPRFDEKLQAWTQPGVFSWDRLDPGSALLLERLPILSGRGADLGAGLGFLSRAVLAASSQIKHIHLFELDRRSAGLAAKNVNPARSTVHWADVRGWKGPIDRLDFVVTNPPFHDGGQEDQSLGMDFLETAARILAKGGTAWVVANRHLPYEAVLREVFARAELLVESGGYKVYKAER